jgi:hypothetical protein
VADSEDNTGQLLSQGQRPLRLIAPGD